MLVFCKSIKKNTPINEFSVQESTLTKIF